MTLASRNIICEYSRRFSGDGVSNGSEVIEKVDFQCLIKPAIVYLDLTIKLVQDFICILMDRKSKKHKVVNI